MKRISTRRIWESCHSLFANFDFFKVKLYSTLFLPLFSRKDKGKKPMKDLKSKGKKCGKFSDCNPKFGSKGTSKDSGDEADEEEDSRMSPTKTEMNTCCFFAKKNMVVI